MLDLKIRALENKGGGWILDLARWLHISYKLSGSCNMLREHVEKVYDMMHEDTTNFVRDHWGGTITGLLHLKLI